MHNDPNAGKSEREKDPLGLLSEAVLHVVGAEALDRGTILNALQAAVGEVARVRHWNAGLAGDLLTIMDTMPTPEGFAEMAAELEACRAANASLAEENSQLREKTALGIGVGDGSGSLFVHGSPDAINRLQALIRRLETLERTASAGGRPN